MTRNNLRAQLRVSRQLSQTHNNDALVRFADRLDNLHPNILAARIEASLSTGNYQRALVNAWSLIHNHEDDPRGYLYFAITIQKVRHVTAGTWFADAIDIGIRLCPDFVLQAQFLKLLGDADWPTLVDHDNKKQNQQANNRPAAAYVGYRDPIMLPGELFHQVGTHLSTIDCINASQVSKEWRHQLLNDNLLWKELSVAELPALNTAMHAFRLANGQLRSFSTRGMDWKFDQAAQLATNVGGKLLEVLSNSPRLQHLEYTSLWTTFDRTTYQGGTFNSLESLAVSTDGFPYFQSTLDQVLGVAPYIPSLQRLRVSDIASLRTANGGGLGPIPWPAPDSLRQLKVLELEAVPTAIRYNNRNRVVSFPMNLLNASAMNNAAPNLQKLSLVEFGGICTNFPPEWPDFRNQKSLTEFLLRTPFAQNLPALPTQLEHLRIHQIRIDADMVPTSIPTLPDLPKLKRLCINSDAKMVEDDGTGVARIIEGSSFWGETLQRSGCQLQSLILHSSPTRDFMAPVHPRSCAFVGNTWMYPLLKSLMESEMTTGLTNLSFSAAQADRRIKGGQVAELVAEKCPELRKLSWTDCYGLGRDAVLKMVTGLPKLKELLLPKIYRAGGTLEMILGAIGVELGDTLNTVDVSVRL